MYIPLGWRSGSSQTFIRPKRYSGGTAPELHRIPHLFPARATGFLTSPQRELEHAQTALEKFKKQYFSLLSLILHE